MKNTKKLAISGIFTALCFVFLFLGSLFQTLDLSAAAIGSLIVMAAFIELGKGWALGVYASASVLSMLLLPNKSAAVVFALFAGFYPILKAPLNRIKPKWLSYLARLACFNLFLTAIIFAGTKLLKIEDSLFEFEIILYLFANLTFFVFDLALERVSVYYARKLRKLIFKR